MYRMRIRLHLWVATNLSRYKTRLINRERQKTPKIVKRSGLKKSQKFQDLIVFPVSLLSQESGLFKLVLEGLHPLLVGDTSVLKHLAHTVHQKMGE